MSGIEIVEGLCGMQRFVFSLIKTVPYIVRIETPLFKVVEIQNGQSQKI